jgi:hypothetical protein
MLLGRVREVINIVLPRGVSVTRDGACNGYAALRSVTIEPGYVELGKGGMTSMARARWPDASL